MPQNPKQEVKVQLNQENESLLNSIQKVDPELATVLNNNRDSIVPALEHLKRKVIGNVLINEA